MHFSHLIACAALVMSTIFTFVAIVAPGWITFDGVYEYDGESLSITGSLYKLYVTAKGVEQTFSYSQLEVWETAIIDAFPANTGKLKLVTPQKMNKSEVHYTCGSRRSV